MTSKWLLASIGVVCALGVYGEREAAACGGCFHPPPPPPPPGAPPTSVDSLITAERMIFSISKDQTTLYDEINYSGSPKSFAWVLPIRGEVEVGLSADVLFAVMDQLTAVSVEAPKTGCPSYPTACGYGSFGSGGGGGGCSFGGSSSSGFSAPGFLPGEEDAGTGADSGVTILAQDQVGPYEMVQLKSNDGSALLDWLTSHGYVVPAADAKVITHYVNEGMDFLALKLVPGEGVNAMQPVRVTTKGAFPVLPLRMVGVGTGPTTGITLWVVADAPWEPQNFPFFTITPDELVWDWATSSSNYESLRRQKESALAGRGWQIESSLDLAQYTVSKTLERAVNENYQGIGNYEPPAPPKPPHPRDAGKDTGAGDADRDASTSPDAVASDGSVLPGDAGEAGASDGALDGTTDDAAGGDAGSATDSGAPPDDAGRPDASPPSPSQTPLELAGEDLDVLFAGVAKPNARITRLRTDIAHAALSDDLVLRAATDPAEIPTAYRVTHEKGQPTCTVVEADCFTTEKLPRDKAIAFEANVAAEVAAQNNAPASGGGCGCKTASGAGSYKTTLGILLGAAAFGGIRARQRKRSRKG